MLQTGYLMIQISELRLRIVPQRGSIHYPLRSKKETLLSDYGLLKKYPEKKLVQVIDLNDAYIYNKPNQHAADEAGHDVHSKLLLMLQA